MTEKELLQLAEEATVQCLHGPFEPAIVVTGVQDVKQAIIPHEFVLKFAQMLLEQKEVSNA